MWTPQSTYNFVHTKTPQDSKITTNMLDSGGFAPCGVPSPGLRPGPIGGLKAAPKPPASLKLGVHIKNTLAVPLKLMWTQAVILSSGTSQTYTSYLPQPRWLELLQRNGWVKDWIFVLKLRVCSSYYKNLLRIMYLCVVIDLLFVVHIDDAFLWLTYIREQFVGSG